MIDPKSLAKSELTGNEIRYLMRKHRVTIRQLSRHMQITQKRIRQVRLVGLKGYWTVLDWVEAILKIEADTNLANQKAER